MESWYTFTTEEIYILALFRPFFTLTEAFYELFSTTWFLLRHYGPTGLWLVLFGSHDVLRSAFQVLASDGERAASDFKKATQDESNMIAVAVRDKGPA